MPSKDHKGLHKNAKLDLCFAKWPWIQISRWYRPLRGADWPRFLSCLLLRSSTIPLRRPNKKLARRNLSNQNNFSFTIIRVFSHCFGCYTYHIIYRYGAHQHNKIKVYLVTRYSKTWERDNIYTVFTISYLLNCIKVPLHAVKCIPGKINRHAQ